MLPAVVPVAPAQVPVPPFLFILIVNEFAVHVHPLALQLLLPYPVAHVPPQVADVPAAALACE